LLEKIVDKKIILEKINSYINLLSKKNTDHGDIIHWFQQSPLHWFLILYVMKYYIEEIELSKNEVVELINNNVMLEGKKTTTTEFKYINDAISKNYITSKTSANDARKKNLLPSDATAKKMIAWLNDYYTRTLG
jgi:hypothetical protein